jgi:hypothetical protein
MEISFFTGCVEQRTEPYSINWIYNFEIQIDSDQNYARQWAEFEREDIYTISEWVKAVRSLTQIKLRHLTGQCTLMKSIWKDPNITKHISYLCQICCSCRQGPYLSRFFSFASVVDVLSC